MLLRSYIFCKNVTEKLILGIFTHIKSKRGSNESYSKFANTFISEGKREEKKVFCAYDGYLYRCKI